MDKTLDIIIPARNEMFLSQTVEDILKNKRGATRILVGLDGAWADPVIKDHPDVTVLHYTESIGQRAISNQLARLSTAKFVMKCDAHCSFDEGFDVKMMNRMQDNYTMVPVMRNLWAFDWKCYGCGIRTYQGPTPEKCKCGSKNIKRKMIWKGKDNPQSTSYCFDSEPHFQYFKEWTKTNEYQEQLKSGLTETMSLQGSCFMMTRDKYWELNICDEEFGSWGSQGIEVAVKTWQSGGKVLVNHDTWYAHMFRTQGGDFGFPYPGPNANPPKRMAKEKFINKDLVWLLDKFWPIPGWKQEDLNELR